MALTVHCPQCEEPMIRMNGHQAEIEIYGCVTHGPYHFGPNTELQPGLPQEREGTPSSTKRLLNRTDEL